MERSQAPKNYRTLILNLLNPMRFKLARWIMRHRGAVSIAFVLITLGFIGGFPGVEIRTVFNDLLPVDDPDAAYDRDHRQLCCKHRREWCTSCVVHLPTPSCSHVPQHGRKRRRAAVSNGKLPTHLGLAGVGRWPPRTDSACPINGLQYGVGKGRACYVPWAVRGSTIVNSVKPLPSLSTLRSPAC